MNSSMQNWSTNIIISFNTINLYYTFVSRACFDGDLWVGALQVGGARHLGWIDISKMERFLSFVFRTLLVTPRNIKRRDGPLPGLGRGREVFSRLQIPF